MAYICKFTVEQLDCANDKYEYDLKLELKN